jgi:hypothetical protein
MAVPISIQYWVAMVVIEHLSTQSEITANPVFNSSYSSNSFSKSALLAPIATSITLNDGEMTKMCPFKVWVL